MDQIAKAPPFIYMGLGVDPYRTGAYFTGLDSLGLKHRERAGRHYKAPDRAPLICCPYFGTQGSWFMTAHSRKPFAIWTSEMDAFARYYDMNIGWTDGSVQPLIILDRMVPKGVQPLVGEPSASPTAEKPVYYYNWSSQEH